MHPKRIYIFCLFLWCGFAVSAQSDGQLDRVVLSSEIEEDLNILESVLLENHPLIQTENEAKGLRLVKDSLMQQLEPSSLREAFTFFADYLDHIGDGHTRVRWNEDQVSYIRNTQGIIDVEFECQEDAVYVSQNDPTTGLRKGDKITAINGVSFTHFCEELTPYVPCDGANRNPSLDYLDRNLPWLFGLHYGFSHSYDLIVSGHEGEEPEVVKCAAAIPAEEFNYWEEESRFDLTIKDELAILTVSQFHGISPRKYKRFLDESFQEISESGVGHLVIDIRGNLGGREGYDNLLLSHLEHSMEKKYLKVSAKSMKSAYYGYFQHGSGNRFKDWLYRTVEFKKDGDEWIRRPRFSNTLKSKDNIFKGKVHVWVDGLVFSSGSDFASLAQEYVEDCLIVGTETLGGRAGNCGGYYYRLELPNTGFHVDIPRIQFVLNVSSAEEERGVIPDVLINSWSEEGLNSNEHYMSITRRLLGKNHGMLVRSDR